MRGVERVAPAAQQMVGVDERDKALGMLGGEENAARVVDADRVVGRRMQHQQRLAQVGDARDQLLLGDVVEKLAPDAERPTRQHDLALALRADIRDLLLEQPGHVARIGWRRDGRDGSRLGDARRGGEHRGAAEAVADQQRGRALRAAQMIGGRHEIGDVGGEIRIGELAFARAEAGEVEAQHRDAALGERLGDALRREIVLAAGEAVGEQRKRGGLARGAFQQRRQGLSGRIGEVETLGPHRRLRGWVATIYPSPGPRSGHSNRAPE